MESRDRNKKPGRTTRKRTPKKEGRPAAPEAADSAESVQHALSLAQKEIDRSLQQIRQEMARFQSQVTEAVKSVHGEQLRELSQVRQAMEGALRGADAPSSKRTRAKPKADEPDDAEVATTADSAILRATGEGVDNVRLAIGHVARAVDAQRTVPDHDRAVQEGLASVESAMRAASDPGEDATSDGVESVRLAVIGGSVETQTASGAQRHGGGLQTAADATAEAVREMERQLVG